MDSFQSFIAGMSEMTQAVSMQMLGIGDMSLLERAEQAQTVEALITQARQNEIAMLRQIDALQDGINRSIDQQIEGIRTGGMSAVEQRTYYLERINNVLGALGTAGSPEEIQMLMGDLSRYVGLAQGSLGDQLYQPMAPWGGDTWADYLVGVLEQGRELSNTAFDEMRDQIQQTNEALIAELELLISALTDFTGVLTGGGPAIEQTINVNVTGDMAGLVRVVTSVVNGMNNNSSAAPIN